ncbi:hypothetical protein KKB18_12495 [bacterium]|nr:hypothetical protein [bacterium]
MNIERILITFCILFYIVMSLFFLFYGDIDADESTYLYAVKMMLEGKIIYKDFFYIQLPLFPYLYGILLKFIGVSILTGRLVSILFATGSVYLSIIIAKRIGGVKAAALCAMLLCLNPYQAYFITITRVYPSSTFFLVLSIFFLTTKFIPTVRNILSIISLCVAIECRLTALPAILPVLAYIYYFDSTKVNNKRIIGFKHVITPIFASILFFVLTMLPFAISAGFYNFLYQNLIYHLRIKMTSYIFQKIFAISTFFRGYFFINILIAVCIAYYWINWRRYKIIFQNRKYGIETCIYAIVFLITILNLSAKYIQPSYQVQIFPFASILVAIGIKRIYDQVESQNLKLAMLLIFVIGALITPVTYGRDDVTMIEGKRATAWAKKMGQYVKSITSENDLIMSSDTPLLAVESDRMLLTGFENMEYYPDWSTRMCERYNLVNDEILEKYIVNKVPKLIIVGDLSYTISMPHRRLIGFEKHKKIIGLIEKYYKLIKKFPNLTHSIRGTSTYIYERED